MREVRLTSLEKIEASDGEVRILANSGDLALVFPRALWQQALAETPAPTEPSVAELQELETLKRRLKEHGGTHSLATVLEDVPCGEGETGEQLDLVLRPAGMFAATTGYLFVPVVSSENVARIGASIQGETFVEQAYIIGAAAESQALAAGDEGVKVLSVRGKKCSSSRFELAPELWQVLSEKLGWKNVEPVAPMDTDLRKEG